MVAGVWRLVGRVVVEGFGLLERQQLVAVLMWWAEIGWLNYVALRRRENHISDSILTSGEEAHGNAGTALCRSSRRIAGLETFVSGKQNKGLFWAARYYHSPIISVPLAFPCVFSSALQSILKTFSIIHLAKA